MYTRYYYGTTRWIISDRWIYIEIDYRYIIYLRPIVAQVCDCKRDRLWIRFPLEEVTISRISYFKFLRSGLVSSATQHLIPADFCGKWRKGVVLTLNFFSTHPALCGIQQKNKKIYIIYKRSTKLRIFVLRIYSCFLSIKIKELILQLKTIFLL